MSKCALNPPPPILYQKRVTPVLHSPSNLSPGGTVELQDIISLLLCDDGSLTEDCPMKRWVVHLDLAFKGIGRRIDSAFDYGKQLADAGFVDVGVVKEKWPTNRWPRDKKYKQIGRLASQTFGPGPRR